MIQGPLVSAIIPTYNRSNIVCEAVESVLQQTYTNIEVIVVDDGSTDDTQARLRPYGNRIRVVAQENVGPAAARNHGIAVSQGELIAFLDSDDIWLPTKIARQVSLLGQVSKSVPCCLCNVTMQWTGRELRSFEIASLHPVLEQGVWVNVDEMLATRFVLFNQAVVIRREVLERIGGFNEKLWLLEDHELSLRLSLEGPWAFIREPLVIWRESTSGSLHEQAKKEALRWRAPMVQILESHLAKLTTGDDNWRLRKHVNRELRKARRELRAAKLSQTEFWGASKIGSVLQKVEQYRGAISRRSPWFPKMKAEPAS
jgi:glycosyltransferase involved in cell wall biosynthesis